MSELTSNLHSQVAVNNDNRMSIREVAGQLGCTPETVKEHIRKIYPDLMKNGCTTYLNEAQVTVLLESMKAANRRYDSSRRNPTYNNIVVGTTTPLSNEFRLAMLYKRDAEIMREAAALERELREAAERSLWATQALLAEMKTGLEATIRRIAGPAGPVPKRKRGKRLSAEPHLEISGEKNPNAKLTEANVREMKIALANGESTKSLAKKYGVSKSAICHIKMGRLWSWLPLKDSGGALST